FGVDLDVLRNEFNSYAARPPLAGNKALIDQSRGHSQTMIDENVQRHSFGGQWGSGVDVFASNGYDIKVTGGTIGENVYAYGESAWYGHAGFNVDWGYAVVDGKQEFTPDGIQPARGHRVTIMNIASPLKPDEPPGP